MVTNESDGVSETTAAGSSSSTDVVSLLSAQAAVQPTQQDQKEHQNSKKSKKGKKVIKDRPIKQQFTEEMDEVFWDLDEATNRKNITQMQRNVQRMLSINVHC